MSAKHPIISITGSSGAGTTSVKRIFELIFRREKIEAAYIEGDAFHRYDRAGMKDKVAAEEQNGKPELHPLPRRGQRARNPCRRCSRNTAARATGRTRTYIHDEEEEKRLGVAAGHVHRVARIPARATCSSTRGCTAAP